MSEPDRAALPTTVAAGGIEAPPAPEQPPSTPLAGQAPARGSQPDRALPFRLGNRPPLTGIRAFGIALVLIFHSNFKALPGAWVALGVFFTLSGFLITAMVAGEHQRTGGISLKKFYARRGVRLLPPLVMTVALLAIYAAVFNVANAARSIWGDSLAALFYFADYRSAFGHEPVIGYLGQCWSLAVEEQFYFIWAILMVVALGIGRRRLAYALAIVGILACTANRLWIVYSAPHFTSHVAGRVYYAFDTRADALFIGCLLGLIATGGHLNDWSRWAKRVLTVLALCSGFALAWIAATVGLASRELPIWWLPVSEIASVIIIAYFVVKPKGAGSRFVGLGIFVFLGNISYTLYLVHWPVYIAISPFSPLGVDWSYWPTEALRMAIILAIAVLSWYAVERPLMQWRRRAL